MNREQEMLDALELAWGLIANAYGGDWDTAAPVWKEAAERWRDEHWHKILSETDLSLEAETPL